MDDRLAVQAQNSRDQKKMNSVRKLLVNLMESFVSLGIFGTTLLVQFYQDDLLEDKKGLAEEAFHEEMYAIGQTTARKISQVS